MTLILWSYWHSNDVPKIVQDCILSWKKYAPEFDIRMIHHNELKEYLDPTQLNSNISQTFTSDLLRLYLLSQYGGLWIDASVMLQTPLKNIFSIYANKIVAFQYNQDYPESWFLFCPQQYQYVFELWYRELCDVCQLFPKVDSHRSYIQVKVLHRRKLYFMVYQTWYYLYCNHHEFSNVFTLHWYKPKWSDSIFFNVYQMLHLQKKHNMLTKYTKNGRKLKQISCDYPILEIEILIVFLFLFIIPVIVYKLKNQKN